MGNICGKQESENWQSPGRPLNSAPAAPPSRSSVPNRAKSNRTYTPESRVVGGGSSESQGSTPAGPKTDSERRAQAAEERAKSKQGDLSKKVLDGKKKSTTQLITEDYEQRRRERELAQIQEQGAYR